MGSNYIKNRFDPFYLLSAANLSDSSALFDDTPEMYIPLSLFSGREATFWRDNPHRLGVLIPSINQALLQIRILGG